jgi:hypothetical protein
MLQGQEFYSHDTTALSKLLPCTLCVMTESERICVHSVSDGGDY